MQVAAFQGRDRKRRQAFQDQKGFPMLKTNSPLEIPPSVTFTLSNAFRLKRGIWKLSVSVLSAGNTEEGIRRWEPTRV